VGGALGSLLVDGVIGGVGGVVAFLPNILLLFLAVAVLEDSGYMARAAFLMDRLMHRIGLHGKSFIPMLIGFGCTVPAIMATRTLDSRRDRLVTMMILPLMSCGARMTIYALFIPAFFPPAWQGPVLWGIYLVGIVLAIACAKLLGKTILRGEAPAFVMELPLYRLPTLRGLAIHAWDRGWLYLRKAGTVILGISIILWALASYPKKQVYDRDYDAQSAAARTTLEADVRSMNLELGLPAESYELPWALRGLEYRARHGDPITPADRRKAADEAQDHASGNPASRPGEQRAVAFLHACAAIDEARARFAGIPLAQGSQSDAQSLALSHLRDQGLADIARSSGPAYPAALRYLDEIEPAYVGQLHDLRNLRRAEELSYSVAGRIGHGLEPALRPLGFDWRIGTALVGAAAAKEVFVAQMGIVFAVGEGREHRDALRSQIQEHYTPLQGLCVMLFCLIGMPCMATVAVTWKESGGKRWAALQLGGLTVLAYVVTLVVYQVGRLLT
jgi:ferrous iron transport protein B